MKPKFYAFTFLRRSSSGVLFFFALCAPPTLAREPYPTIDPTTQMKRDELRKEILRTELREENKAIDDARHALTNALKQQAPAQISETFRDQVVQHTQNVETLLRELAAVGNSARQVTSTQPMHMTRSTSTTSTSTTPSTPFWDVYKRMPSKPADAIESRSSSFQPLELNGEKTP